MLYILSDFLYFINFSWFGFEFFWMLYNRDLLFFFIIALFLGILYISFMLCSMGFLFGTLYVFLLNWINFSLDFFGFEMGEFDFGIS